MPIRKMTYEAAVDAVSEAVRELRAAAANLERAMPDEPHQERAVRVMTYECDELTSALAVFRDLHADSRPSEPEPTVADRLKAEVERRPAAVPDA